MGGNVVRPVRWQSAMRWRWNRGRRALGWPGLAGAALLFLAAAFHLAATLPENARSRELQQQLAQAKRRAAAPATFEITSPAARLAAFYEQFPRRDTLAAWLELLYAAGQHASLALDKAEYKLAAERNSPLLRYEINLPLSGGYLQVRGFVQEVLERIPTLALQDFQVKRGNIAEPKVEVRLRFVLYLREAA